jgi:DNA gyrase subunit B
MDVDGSNICSLLINFLASNWIELFKQERVYRVLTPLMIVRDGKKQIDIYSEEEYEQFLKENPNKSFRVEYKKGLGALSDIDYKNMMKNPKLLKITVDESYEESLKNWFGNDSSKRKELLR